MMTATEIELASLRDRYSRLIRDFERDMAFFEGGNYLYAGPTSSPTDVTENAKKRVRHTIAELTTLIDAIDRRVLA